MATATTTKVLDRTRFEARARLLDIVACGILLVGGATLLFEMYTLGYTAAVLDGNAGSVIPHDRGAVRMIIEAFITALGFSWIAYRLFAGSAKRVGG